MPSKPGFVIDSLPRTGSTTLARLLSCHPDIDCLIEPFHPRRYGGQFYEMALKAGTVVPALNLIWHRWRGIKHVWESSKGWPFPFNPELNDAIVLGASQVIVLQRRNLLRRFVSGVISQQLDFWIGEREEYCARLEKVQLRRLEARTVAEEIQKARAAIDYKRRLISNHDVPTIYLFYEDLFSEKLTNLDRLENMNHLLNFLGFRKITENEFSEKWASFFDSDRYRWADPGIYRLIPGIDEIERQVGSDENGWLFRESLEPELTREIGGHKRDL